MATYTSHLNLKLPDYSEVADVKDLNDNFKKIDDAIASGGTGGGTGGITQETDPTVPSWAKQPNKPTYTAAEVGALPNTTVIPTVPTTLPNPQPIVINGVSYDGSEKKEITIQAEDGGIVTETDPTVPAWAKAANKPTYTADEVGALPSTYEPPVKSVNGKTGDVTLAASDVGALPNTTVIPTVPTALKNPYPITINGVAYDGSEAKTITIQAADGGESVSLDTTLTQYGMAADAGATGNAIAQETAAREQAVNELNEAIDAQSEALNAINEKNAAQDESIADKLGKAEQAADSAKLGGVAASEYAKKTDIPEDMGGDADTLGGKAPEYYIQPRNLLDNSDFTNPVNQRCVSETISAAGYFIDRWKLVSGSVTISDEGLTLNGTISQIIEKAPSGTVTASASAGEAAFDADTNTFSLTGSGVLVTWAALYEGAYTADTLPPYVPKGYAAELAECRRYFHRFGTTNGNNQFGFGFGNTTTIANMTLDNVEMRMQKPTITFSETVKLYNCVSSQSVVVTGISMNDCVGGYAYINATGSSVVNGRAYYFRTENATIDISADL